MPLYSLFRGALAANQTSGANMTSAQAITMEELNAALAGEVKPLCTTIEDAVRAGYEACDLEALVHAASVGAASRAQIVEGLAWGLFHQRQADEFADRLQYPQHWANVAVWH